MASTVMQCDHASGEFIQLSRCCDIHHGHSPGAATIAALPENSHPTHIEHHGSVLGINTQTHCRVTF